MIDSSLKEAIFFVGGKECHNMKGKVLSIITAVLFGATMVAAPIVMAAGMDSSAGMEEQKAPVKAEKKAKKKKAKKSTAKKTTKKKHAKKKKAAAPAPEEK
jgi:mannitol-specific phosphotransferase system IIBC component